MKLIHLATEFECLGEIYPFDIMVVIGEPNDLIKFRFDAGPMPHDIPIVMQHFELYMTQKRNVVYNSISSSDNILLEHIRSCAEEFAWNFEHADLPMKKQAS